jgi:tRNA(fMet)-specific endonuclease VapC
MPNQYLLDTNIISDFMRNPAGRAATPARTMANETLCTSIVVSSELRYGCEKKGSPKLLRQVESVLSALEILPLDVPTDRHYGVLRAKLDAAGEPIGYNDLFIAAQALTHGMILVTANEREFSKAPGLIVENWLK